MAPNSETMSLLYLQKNNSPKFPLNLFPKHIRPYLELARIEKPTGVILMFWPFAWGLTLAAYRTAMPPDIYILSLAKCVLAALIVRSAACTVNDIFDREIDAGVERTKNRPLASGRISVRAATVYLFFQYAIGIACCSRLPHLSFWVAMAQLLPVFVIYPLLKRVTYWPQAWLGFAMNFGVPIAWTATVPSLDWLVISPMIVGCWCWTVLYDTIYACQDMEDDVKIGVRSTAILFGSWIRPLLIGCGSVFVAMLAQAGIANNQHMPYFVVSVGGTAAHLIWQFWTVDLGEPQSCWVNFQRNGHLGWIIWGGLFLDYLLCTNVTT